MGKGTIVVSLRSKGIPTYNKGSYLDIRYQALQLATELWDTFLSALVSTVCLSWTGWISVAVSITSIAGMVTTDYASAPGVLVVVALTIIVLPLFILLTFVFRRRDRALVSLAELKAAFVSLILHRPAGSTQQQREASNELYIKAATFIDDVRVYLQHRRPYARHFYFPLRSTTPRPTDSLLKVSRELGLLLRRVHRGVRDMHLACARLRETGVSEKQVSDLVSRVERVHAAVEQLSVIKEMRTPVLVRAFLRWFIVVIIPVGFGPYWNSVAKATRNRAYAGFMGVLLQLALASVLDCVVAMEDPFDDTALDAVSLFEMMDQVGVMTTLPNDPDGYDPDFTGTGTGDPAEPRPLEAVPSAHVAMYMSGIDPTGGTSGGSSGGGAVAATGPAAAAANGAAATGLGSGGLGPLTAAAPQPVMSVTDSVPGTSGGNAAGSREPSREVQPQGPQPPQMQPACVAAMRASMVTSETAVGPPSAMEAYGGGAGNGTALPSITSPASADMVALIRAGGASPPLPALAGQATGNRSTPAVY